MTASQPPSSQLRGEGDKQQKGTMGRIDPMSHVHEWYFFFYLFELNFRPLNLYLAFFILLEFEPFVTLKLALKLILMI